MAKIKKTPEIKKLSTAALEAGFSAADISEILAKFGPGVLQICIDAFREGMTVSVVRQLLDLFGPIFLQNATRDLILKREKENTKFSADIIEGEQINDFIDNIIDDEIKDEVIKIIHYLIVDKYGKLLLEIIFRYIVSFIKHDKELKVKIIKLAERLVEHM